MTTARSTAKTRSSRSSSRKIACQGFRSFDATILPTPTIALRPAAPAVGAEREPRRDGGDGQEREPALDPVNVAQHALDLVGKDVGEPEAHRDAEHGGRRVAREARPQPPPGGPPRAKGAAAEPHHVARREHDLCAVLPAGRLEPLFAP